MGLHAIVTTIFLVTLFSGSSGVDVSKFGAVGDGQANDSPAFLKAWAAVCGAPGDGVLLIPKGKTFLLQPLVFKGPCKPRRILVQALGKIVGPKKVDTNCKAERTWVTFDGVNGLSLDGSGELNGQGPLWWQKIDSLGCPAPTGLRFESCNDLRVTGLSSIDSPRNHISISNCIRVFISKIRLTAPDESPNTDGINISKSSDVLIFDSFIGTGDDCIAINDGSSKIDIRNLHCGPGHGISIGSLGYRGQTETVDGVSVRNCKFTGTQNGARIKTWVGGSGFARRIIFDNIILDKVENPIIINQKYVDRRKVGETREDSDFELEEDSEFEPEDIESGDFVGYQKGSAKAVDISDVTFSNFRGTSATEEAISLTCAGGKGCANIRLSQISITSAVPGKRLQVVCENAHGTSTSTVPAVPCLAGPK